LAGWGRERFSGLDLVAVVSADMDDQFTAVLEALRPLLHEIVCCDGTAEGADRPALGVDLASRAVESHWSRSGLRLHRAERRGRRRPCGSYHRRRGFRLERRAVLVVGSAAVVQRVRDHLDSRAPGPV
jgi:hypothetical protein